MPKTKIDKSEFEVSFLARVYFRHKASTVAEARHDVYEEGKGKFLAWSEGPWDNDEDAGLTIDLIPTRKELT